MDIYQINYDLNSPHQDYDGLIKEIKKTDYCNYLKSGWLIYTNESAGDICKRLEKYLDNNDFILITKLSTDRQGWLPQKVWDWINSKKKSYSYSY